MTLVQSPYLNRTAIKDDRDFFGRRRELELLFTRIDAYQPQSVSVVGERRIGKSSLLRAVYRKRGTLLGRPDEFVFVLLDLQERMHAGVSDFFASLIEEVALACQDRSLGEQPPSYETVRRLVSTLERRRLKLVVLLDEFEAITQNRNFGLEFFSFLRSLPNNFSVAFIVTSVQDLRRLCHSNEVAGSPFFNIFHKLNLGCFLPEDARQLIREPSAAAGFSLERYESSIVSLAGHFPFFLQLACSAFFDFYRNQAEGAPVEPGAVRQGFCEEARDHFEYVWSHMSEREREVCAKLEARESLNAAERSCLEGLVRRGYVQVDPSGPRLFSEVFEAFVRTRSTGELPRPSPASETVPHPVVSETPTAKAGEKPVEILLDEMKIIEDRLRERHLCQLSVLFADLVGSTSAGEKLGPFGLRILVSRLEGLVRPIVARHGGTFVKLVGDAVIARFCQPEEAAAAGIAILDNLARLNVLLPERDKIHVKIAIHHGEAGIAHDDVFGDAINGAERVLRQTAADQLLVSGSVVERLSKERAACFAEQGRFKLKGMAGPVHLFRYRSEAPCGVPERRRAGGARVSRRPTR